MTHLDLFSGIGGFALAARWAGWETVQFVEIDKHAQGFLQLNFPEVPIHDDIRTLDTDAFRGRIDCITAGVPCQPASAAGKRKGVKDERWLWGATIDVVDRIRPRWVILENVLGLLNLKPIGLEWIVSQLEEKGYSVHVSILGADHLGFAHRRRRVWIVAHDDRTGTTRLSCGKEQEVSGVGISSKLADSDSEREQQQEGMLSELRGRFIDRSDSDVHNTHSAQCPGNECTIGNGQEHTHIGGSVPRFTQSRLGGTVDGIPSRLVKRVASPGQSQYDWERPRTCKSGKGRAHKLKGYGNAIVPQCAYVIMDAINRYETR